MSVNISRASETTMSSIDLPTLILTQIPTRTRLADTRALMQLVQAVAEQEWEREINEEVEKVKEEG
jgi:hypothetical protein